MKAMLCKAHGPPESLVLEELESPPLGARDVRIDVHAAGVNFPDLLIIAGRYQFKPDMPFAPGAEVSGVVSETGADVEGVAVGDRVIGMTRWNGFADEVVVAEERCLAMPAHMPFTIGAGFSMTYGTSYHALVQRGELVEGETLLVHGATGGVGTAAVEIGGCLGARVIATGGDDGKLDAIRTRYAIDAVLNYRTTPDWKDRVKALSAGNGADVIYDPVGGDVFETSLRCVNWNGRILVVGFASGTIPAAKANLVLLKGCAVVGVFWGAFVTREPAQNKANFDQLFAWYEAGRLGPIVSDTMPLDRAAEAMRKLERREVVGKIVLTTGR